ncbi:hypothetical protein D9601_09700 [Sphingomonas sp. MA1305]|uniref:hypothetical protein n=1 Tax=Sphingomonas sp. MA1305 TaxID=2479204 RepID=UPI0018E02455|nr:hypothetical protein [Sphingomonas sp. MA1305]MBI0475624.1 hypothetical protein [Sphingomonas sp. MA1305]
MSGERGAAIVLAILAGLGLPVGGLALFISPMLFDAPAAGGWPVNLLFAGCVAWVPCFLVALILAIAAATGKRATARHLLLRLALVALLLPIVLIGSGYVAVQTVCGGQFACKGAAG